MTTSPIILDGLWQCICPPFKYVPSSARSALLKASARRPAPFHPRVCALLCASSVRSNSTAASVARERTFFSGRRIDERAIREINGRRQSNLSTSDSTEALEKLDTPAIYDRLRKVAAKGDIERVNQLVYYLLTSKGQAPNIALYSASILSNVNAESGLAGRAAALLKEMGEVGLEPTAEICHDIIKVLAVHPDYLLRSAILEYMRQRWFPLRIDGHHDVVVGMLRERQFEMALNRLDMMVGEGMKIESWLYDMVIHMLCHVEEMDEALRIMKFRIESGELNISKIVWQSLLDAASSTFHHEATEYVWKRQVQQSYLNPSSGTCFNVLATAARHGDAALATEVFRLLGERREIFTQQHYEMLVDTYILAYDIQTALSVFCIMQKNGTPPDEYSTRQLVKWARSDTGRAQEAFEILRSLKESGESVPIAVVNCLMEAAIYQNDIEQAIEQYKALHVVCDSGSTTTTFNVLLRGCQKRKDLAMFLAAEMVALNVEPDSLTYDRLLLICLNNEDYEDAFRYYEEMRSKGWTPRSGTYVAMARRCARAKDPRAWEVVDVMVECGIDGNSVNMLKKWLNANWGKVSMSDPELTR